MQVKELGHAVLYVRDLAASCKFYGELLGWREVGRYGDAAAVFSAGQRTHHEVLLIQVAHDAAPIPTGPRVGLYHLGLKIGESDDELRTALAEVRAAGVPIVGMSDHGVTHSLYIRDPDGNEIELYIDVLPAVWREQPLASMMTTRPLHL
jgi:catechol 2,3-dioxygenase